MKSRTPVAWLTSLFAIVAASDPLSAQSVASRPTGDPVVELSPFVVNSTKETGYQASTTLAGTRLDTPLKELGAAISIYTKDFLDDIGATTAPDFLIYATGMEAAGPGGNFTNAGNGDINQIGVGTNGPRENPGTVSRARGLAGPTSTRDFFNTSISTDSYNVERVTVLRGPNSALIGAGSPAGIVDTTLAQADVKRNQNKVTFRLDNNGGYRAVADFNRVLIPDKLAARLIGLDARAEFNQRPAYQRDERIFGAVTYRPFKTTTLRANFESGRMDSNQPITPLLQNGIANEWYLAGRPGFDWTFYDDPARNPSAANEVSSNFFPYYTTFLPGGTFMAFYNNNSDRQPSSIIQSNFPSTTGAVANSIRAGTLHPLLNRDLATDSGRFSATRNMFELPAASYWIGGNVLPGQLSGQQPPGLKNQGFTDSSMFDWENRMIDESGRTTQNFHTASAVFSQTAWDNRLGIELAYNTQTYWNRPVAAFLNGNGFAAQLQIRVDTSVVTPEGLPNPNLGRPFLSTPNFRYRRAYDENETMRATAFAKYDFKDMNDRWGKWLGRHTLSGVSERYRTDFTRVVSIVKMDGPAVRDIVANINASSAVFNVYLGPSLIGNTNSLQLNPIRIPPTAIGPYGEISTFVRAANTTDPGGYRKSPVALQELVQPGNATREVIKSQAVVLQSNWLQDHIATVVGWRRDTDYQSDTVDFGFNNNPTRTGPYDTGKVLWGLNDFSFPNTPAELVSADTKTYSIVANWPQKLIRLPRGTDFSVFYNKSDNFTPSGRRTDDFGINIDPPKGETTEYGFNLSTFNDKLVFRLNRYETSNKLLGYNGAAGSGGMVLLLTTLANWAEEGNTNPQLVAMRQADSARLLNLIPPGVLELYNYRVTGTTPNIVAAHESAPATGRSATTDYDATGVEMDIVYNPTPNWRILLNVAKQETVKSNTMPFIRDIAAKMAPIVAEIGGRAWDNYPVGWQIGTPLPANIQTFAQRVDQQQTTPLALDLATEGFPSAEQRKWRVNLVTSYRLGRDPFFGERLKGWTIGGGVRWQSKFAMAFPATRLANGTPIFDIANPWYAPHELNVDAFVGYARRIWNDRIDWSVRLNGTNLYRERELIPIVAQPWGQPAHMRLAPEQRWYLTNSFGF